VSVNVGTEAVTAIQELRGNPHFARLVAALEVFTVTRMLAAQETAPELRVDATAYARGFYHLWQAMQSAYAGQHMSQVKPTSTRGGKVTADV
jgi:hypothetical protein